MKYLYTVFYRYDNGSRRVDACEVSFYSNNPRLTDYPRRLAKAVLAAHDTAVCAGHWGAVSVNDRRVDPAGQFGFEAVYPGGAKTSFVVISTTASCDSDMGK